MTIAFAAASAHAPGIVAWRDAASAEQRERIYGGFDRLHRRFAGSGIESLVLFTSEHWVNFFLDHISAFCVGRAETYTGPVEPWLKIDRTEIPGDPKLANAILEACYRNDFDPGFSYEMDLDHGTIVPLHFLTPQMRIPIVPIMINTLAPPVPSTQRCLALGKIVGEIARGSSKRIGLMATGGLSHDPGERNHGLIDRRFDRAFLKTVCSGDMAALSSYTVADLAAAGAGAIELLSWIALAGALQSYRGELIAYEAVEPWATGIGIAAFHDFPSDLSDDRATAQTPMLSQAASHGEKAETALHSSNTKL